MLQVEREDTEDIVSNGLEPSVFCYIAFVAFQAFLIDFTEAKEVLHWCRWEQVPFNHAWFSFRLYE